MPLSIFGYLEMQVERSREKGEKIDLLFKNSIAKTHTAMSLQLSAQLHVPVGFADSEKCALNPITGDLLPWKWSSLNPADFCIDRQNNLWHYCDNEKTWSAAVRNGLLANNFFENAPPLALSKDSAALETASQTFLGTDVEVAAATKLQALQRGRAARFTPPPVKSQKIHIGKRGNNKASVSTSGHWHSRKKKYKKTKYKNSNIRRRKHVDKRHKKKAFNKFRRGKSVKKAQVVVPREEVCAHCLIDRRVDNIFDNPCPRYCCDFCAVSFNGDKLSGKVCSYCLYQNHREKFCQICEKNLGQWHADWRMTHNIPPCHHPRRCLCKECSSARRIACAVAVRRRQHPCVDCGMASHTVLYCPWRAATVHGAPLAFGEPVQHGDTDAVLIMAPDGYPVWVHDYDLQYNDPERIEDYLPDPIEEAVRDDYLFGWG